MPKSTRSRKKWLVLQTFPNDKQLLTLSARCAVETADEWANSVDGSDIGVRHLVASYILIPPAAHRDQMNSWGFKERPWRNTFFEYISDRYTAEAWNDAARKVSPSKAVGSFERQNVKGKALAFRRDTFASQVLERATRYHAKRSDTWLGLQKIRFAVIEQARNDAAVREEIAPVWDAVRSAESRYRAVFNSYIPTSAPTEDVVSFDDLDISPRVLNGLETARGLMFATRHNSDNVGVLQLAASAISRRVDADADLTALGLDPQALCLEMIRHAAVLGESAEKWREALGEEEAAPIGRTLDLNSDEPEATLRLDKDWTSDPLGSKPNQPIDLFLYV